MTKLTLPIQIGRRYVRRDGVIVEARKWPYGHDDALVYVGESESPPADTSELAWRSDGTHHSWLESQIDLVADAPEEQAAQPTGHPHAELMAQYAEDARTHAEPWRLWQWRNLCGQWIDCSWPPSWPPEFAFRRKPRLILINGHEVPEPLRVAPPVGAQVYIVNLADMRGTDPLYWAGDGFDMRCLSRGIVHLTREAAQAHARALLSFTTEGEA